MTATPSEAVALRWVRRYLRGHHCPRCDREWITAASVGVLVHRCSPPPRRGLPPPWSAEAVLAEERQRWAERQLGASTFAEALEDALGDRALRPIEEEV